MTVKLAFHFVYRFIFFFFSFPQDERKKTWLSFNVSTFTRNGLLRIVILRCKSLLADGDSSGPKAEIYYRLHRTANIQDQSIEVDQKGYIYISTTEWGKIKHPDYCNVTYQIEDYNSINLSNSVLPTIATYPDDTQFVFVINAEKKEARVNVTTADKDFLDKLIDYAIRGIFWVNEQAVGWVINLFK